MFSTYFTFIFYHYLVGWSSHRYTKKLLILQIPFFTLFFSMSKQLEIEIEYINGEVEFETSHHIIVVTLSKPNGVPRCIKIELIKSLPKTISVSISKEFYENNNNSSASKTTDPLFNISAEVRHTFNDRVKYTFKKKLAITESNWFVKHKITMHGEYIYFYPDYLIIFSISYRSNGQFKSGRSLNRLFLWKKHFFFYLRKREEKLFSSILF
jgi:antitoxin component YwqK of YwqJK toxin-antitoxin module